VVAEHPPGEALLDVEERPRQRGGRHPVREEVAGLADQPRPGAEGHRVPLPVGDDRGREQRRRAEDARHGGGGELRQRGERARDRAGGRRRRRGGAGAARRLQDAHRASVRRRPASTIAGVKVLLVTLYFPPAGGGGVQRPLKLAQYLPALGIETHVLAPDDPRWIHRDDDLRPPTQAWVHRARYLGPRGRKPAEELHGRAGLARLAAHARLASRRLLVPDENVSWNLTAIPAAIRIARKEGIDAVITTSPPASVHLVGAAVRKATGARWLADLRDSVVAHPHRRAESAAVRAKERVDEAVARLVARQADAISCVSDAIAAEARALGPRGPLVTIPNGCDFDDVAGLEYTPAQRFRITHAGSFFGKRDPRPFLQALHDSKLDVVARFLGDFRSADREWAERLGLGD